MFREAIRNKTPLGILADSYISKGNLVPDDVTIALVKERLSKGETLEDILVEAFATAREAAFRVIGEKHYFVPKGRVIYEKQLRYQG